MSFVPPSTVVQSAARTVTGQSGPVASGPIGKSVSLFIDCTAVGGVGPTLDLSLEWSNDGNSWAAAEPADTFTQITAAKKVVKTFARKAAMYRLRWTLGGTTPSFTFSAIEYVIP